MHEENEIKIYKYMVANVLVKYRASFFHCELKLKGRSCLSYQGKVALHAGGIDIMSQIMQTLNLAHWRDLVRCQIRCKINGHGNCVAIGHPKKDQWFSFDDFNSFNKFNKFKKEVG